MRTLLLVLTLLLASPAFAIPVAGIYDIQFEGHATLGTDPQTGATILSQEFSPIGTFTSDGTTFTSWNFGVTGYDRTFYWTMENSYPFATVDLTRNAVSLSPPDRDGALRLVFDMPDHLNRFETQRSFDLTGFFTYAPSQSVPLPGMLWPTVGGLWLLAVIMGRRRVKRLSSPPSGAP